MAAKSRWLWIGDQPVPGNVVDAACGLGELTPYRAEQPLASQLGGMSLAVVGTNGKSGDGRFIQKLVDELQQGPTVAVFLLPPEADAARRLIAQSPGHFICAAKDGSATEIAAHFAAALAIQPAVSKLHSDLDTARKLSCETERTMREMDQEMRLAARLQRDFLPRRLPEVGGARFGVLYRPASWVSGDIYDVVRLDETRVGFYVADVVGHGLPAALLTMFIKKALQTKRILGNTYEIVPPHITLKELNTDICQQNLPNCQFCTAVYCVLDTQSLVLTFARAGHPEPVVMHPEGQVERLWAPGSLLGVFPDENYQSEEYQLRPGDRLMLHTDGADAILSRGPTGEVQPLEESLGRLGNLSREEMLLQLTAGAELSQDNRVLEDDITIMVMDVQG